MAIVQTQNNMIYRKFKDLDLSLLGFGCMRLPLLDDGTINEPLCEEMFDYAIKHGINYFDTAYPYLQGYSEIVVGKILKKYDRKSFYLASKFPGHQFAKEYHPDEIFAEQLIKCDVDYFDFYLLHNVYEKSIETYRDPRWGIVDYFLEEKKKGRIKHLGFSCHGKLENLKEFLDLYADKMEFCQLQINYLDWTLQDAKAKYELVSSYNIPIWVMEPVRGGKLVNLNESQLTKLHEANPSAAPASSAFRFLIALDKVGMILSGMSNMDQVVDNIKTFENYVPLSNNELDSLMMIAEDLKNIVPCTGCKYCVAGCPKHLNIPYLLDAYNDIKTDIDGGLTASMQIEILDDDKKPSNCISCKRCNNTCPQKIDVASAISDLNKIYATMPKWKDISDARIKEAEIIRDKLNK